MPRKQTPSQKGQVKGKRKDTGKQKKIIYVLAVAFIFIYIASLLIRDISQSLFIQKPDRINIVVYGEYPVFYSFGVREVGNYAISFYPDLKVQIPGGYGQYRIGALGKFIKLEKKPELLTSTFTSITSTFISYYFYPDSDEVFYGGKSDDEQVAKPNIKDIFLMKSNASFIDKLYLIYLLHQLQSGNVYDMDYLPYEQVKDDTIFKNSTFIERYIGYFYQKTYRKDNMNVQIIYSESYSTADNIASILNGNGILVGDISRKDTADKKCIVIQNEDQEYSITSRDIAEFFNCDLKKGKTDVYDILLVLGNLETTWEVE